MGKFILSKGAEIPKNVKISETINQIDIIDGEGIMEYIRRSEAMLKETSNVSGIPQRYFGRQNKGMTIMGNSEFIEKFLAKLPDEFKNSK